MSCPPPLTCPQLDHLADAPLFSRQPTTPLNASRSSASTSTGQQAEVTRGVCGPDEVDAVREGVHGLPLLAHVIDPDLGVRHTTAKPGLGVGLVLDLPVALGRSCMHTGSVRLTSSTEQSSLHESSLYPTASSSS